MPANRIGIPQRSKLDHHQEKQPEQESYYSTSNISSPDKGPGSYITNNIDKVPTHQDLYSNSKNIKNTPETDKLKILTDYLDLGSTQLASGMIINSKKNLKKFMKGSKDSSPTDPDQSYEESIERLSAYANNYLGCLENFNGNLTKSLEYFQKSLEIFFTDCGVGAVSTGAATNNIGSLFYELRDTDQAIEFHRSAQTIMKNLKVDKTVMMGDIYYNLGLDYMQKCDYQGALEVLKKATEIYLRHDGEEQVQVSETFGAIGNCLYWMGIKQDAIDF
jgi:tetratricopeptide (TPR) repeat protein